MGKKTIIFVLYALALWGTARFCHHQTDGFRIEKLRNNTASPATNTSYPFTIKHKNLLDQKYSYLGRGLQSFSFLSEDGTTVLKIFNNRYQKKIARFKIIPPIGPLKSWKKHKIAYNEKKLSMAFESYALAYSHLKEEAGLLYLKTDNHSLPTAKVMIIDKLGIQHEIKLEKMAFALQKKAILTYPYLSNLAKSKDFVSARKAFLSIIKHLKHKMSLGIHDRDPLIRTNLGFLEDTPMQIDLGPFSIDPSLKNPSRQKAEIKKITLSLKHWIENNQPELLPYFHEALQTP